MTVDEIVAELPKDNRMEDPRTTILGYLRNAPCALEAISRALATKSAADRAFIERCLSDSVITKDELRDLLKQKR